MLSNWTSLYFADDYYNGTVKVLGFRCVSGDGLSEDTAFRFELIYQSIEGSEMDFSAVTESLVSIQDEKGNEVALTDGKAVIKNGYVITSQKPLVMPQVYCGLKDSNGNFAYTVKNLVETPITVSYDTTGFKGTISAYSYLSVSGYEGKSEKRTTRYISGGSPVSFDFSRGTTLAASTSYHYDLAEKWFDIYDANGTKINDLFDFTAERHEDNYYTYTPKQNIEGDISVFAAGTEFTLTLPEGVEIENKDVIVSQEGNVYTVKPAADVTLLSDKLLNIYNGSVLLVSDLKYSAVINHKFVYKTRVTNKVNAEISNASIIRTQEELANAKTGDYIMPTETLNIMDEGYQWVEMNKYLQTLNGYYDSGYGTSSTITIDADLIVYQNSSATFVPANPDLCTSGSYDIETYKGNAWRVDFAGEKYGKTRMELSGVNYVEPAEYEFTWADDNRTATATFNGEETVDAVVELEQDYENKQFIYTATAVYNGIPHIETKNVNIYTVEWKNDDGTTIDTTVVEEGIVPTHAEPTKADDDYFTYTFAGWTPAVTAVTGDTTYTATYTKKGIRLFAGHSITLGGDIGVNFYIDPAVVNADIENAESATVEFSFDKYTSSVNLKDIEPEENGWYKATCNIPAAYMAHKIHAEVYIDGEKLDETNDYSVQDYAETILADPAKYDSEKPEKLAALVKEMLNYGEKAQTVFSGQMNTAAEYNEIESYSMTDVTAEMIQAAIEAANSGNTATDLSTLSEVSGAKYYTNSLIFLSQNTLRIYFTKSDNSFDASAFDGDLSGYFYYVEIPNIAARELDTLQEFNVGGTTFRYSALDYAKAVIESNMADSAKDLAKSLYLYNQAANAYFDVV